MHGRGVVRRLERVRKRELLVAAVIVAPRNGDLSKRVMQHEAHAARGRLLESLLRKRFSFIPATCARQRVEPVLDHCRDNDNERAVSPADSRAALCRCDCLGEVTGNEVDVDEVAVAPSQRREVIQVGRDRDAFLQLGRTVLDVIRQGHRAGAGDASVQLVACRAHGTSQLDSTSAHVTRAAEIAVDQQAVGERRQNADA